MPETKKKIRDVLSAAETALAEGMARAARFADAQDFKRSLLKALDTHPKFRAAALALHVHIQATPRPGSSQAPRKIIPSGRVQASRHDSPKGRSKPKGR